MHQNWGKLLFLHWSVPVSVLRPMIPKKLEIDTHEGGAWVSITPFTMWGIRPTMLPAIPGLSDSHELNVRTYVHAEGVPGVWFFSLDASNVIAVLAARLGFHLPYFQAEMYMDEAADTISFTSRRTDERGAKAEFSARWTRGKALPTPAPDSLEFFLVERYCLYAAQDEKLYRARIHHQPWSLRAATIDTLSSTMGEAHGMKLPDKPALVHAQGESLAVEIWPLKELARP
ncbi:MAG: YqjF family protein [Gemmatimonadaceae bacterium]